MTNIRLFLVIFCTSCTLLAPQHLLSMKLRAESQEYTICDAAKDGNLEQVQYMLKNGADINVQDGRQERSPLMHAITHGHVKIAQHLIAKKAHLKSLAGDNGAFKRENGTINIYCAYDALYYAITYRQVAMVKYFLKELKDTELALTFCQNCLRDAYGKTMKQILENEYLRRQKIDLEKRRKKLLRKPLFKKHTHESIRTLLETQNPTQEGVVKIEMFVNNAAKIKKMQEKMARIQQEQQYLLKCFEKAKNYNLTEN